MSKAYITVSSGMRGWYSVMVDDEGVIVTGLDSYATSEGAEEEAKLWAASEKMRFEPVNKTRSTPAAVASNGPIEAK